MSACYETASVSGYRARREPFPRSRCVFPRRHRARFTGCTQADRQTTPSFVADVLDARSSAEVKLRYTTSLVTAADCRL